MSLSTDGYIDIRDRRVQLALLAVPGIALFAAHTIRRLVRQAAFRDPIIYKAPSAANVAAAAGGSESAAYPEDAIEGARDVNTPYGSIRVYEWGPEDGKKVLFVHGISTPCPACAQIAQQLVDEAGCRVMLFDLFGRGYSDAPDPAEFKHDIRLFTSQILLVLATSTVSWTGEENSFTLVGYSLGGGISAAFASYFPQLVDSLVLIAPAGLMRANRFHWSSKLIYGGLMPDLWRNFLVTRRLAGPSPRAATAARAPPSSSSSSSSPPTSSRHQSGSENAPSSPAELVPGVVGSAADVVVWQVQQHPGFLSSFISSIRYGPISTEHDRWRIIGSRLTAQKRPGASLDEHRAGLREGKVLIIFGKADSVVVPEETAEDAVNVLGQDNVRIEMLHGGHDVPYTNARACVDAIRDHWDMEL